MIAAKAVAFKIAASRRSSRSARSAPCDGARILAERLLGRRRRRGRGQGAHRRHRRAPGPGRPARLRAGRPAGRGPAAPRSASRSTATPSRSTRARRWSPPGCGSAPRRWPPAASATADFAEVADIIAAALKPDFDDEVADASARPGRGPRRQVPALPEPRLDANGAGMMAEHAAGAPGLPVAQPGAEALVRRGDRRRRRPRPGHRLLPGQEPRHHQHRRAGEGLAGRRQHGPQHHDHPLQLPVGRERGDLRARAEAVGGPARRSSSTTSCSASAV